MHAETYLEVHLAGNKEVKSFGPVSEVGLEIKQLTRIKQSQIEQPWQSAGALSEPEPIHGKGHAVSLTQLPKPGR